MTPAHHWDTRSCWFFTNFSCEKFGVHIDENYTKTDNERTRPGFLNIEGWPMETRRGRQPVSDSVVGPTTTTDACAGHPRLSQGCRHARTRAPPPPLTQLCACHTRGNKSAGRCANIGPPKNTRPVKSLSYSLLRYPAIGRVPTPKRTFAGLFNTSRVPHPQGRSPRRRTTMQAPSPQTQDSQAILVVVLFVACLCVAYWRTAIRVIVIILVALAVFGIIVGVQVLEHAVG